jgi:hypothetical protein
MLVFVSYCLRDFPVVKSLILQLGVLGHNVQYEPKMPAGQIRWSHVLESIRACDVFLLGVTDHTLLSESRALEVQYARRVGKPVRAVLLEEITGVLPSDLGEPINYIGQSKQDADHLDLALKAAERTPRSAKTDLEMELDPVDPDWRIPLMKLHTIIQAQSISSTGQQQIIWNIQEFLERQETFRAGRTLLKSFAARHDLDPSVRTEVEETARQLRQSYVSQQRARWRNTGLISLFVLGIVVVAGFFLYRRQQTANRAAEATLTEQAVQVTQTGFVNNKYMTETAIVVVLTEGAHQTETAQPTATMTQTPDARFIYESIFTDLFTSSPTPGAGESGLATPPGSSTGNGAVDANATSTAMVIAITQTNAASGNGTVDVNATSTAMVVAITQTNNASGSGTVDVNATSTAMVVAVTQTNDASAATPTADNLPTRTLLPPVTPGGS